MAMSRNSLASKTSPHSCHSTYSASSSRATTRTRGWRQIFSIGVWVVGRFEICGFWKFMVRTAARTYWRRFTNLGYFRPLIALVKCFLGTKEAPLRSGVPLWSRLPGNRAFASSFLFVAAVPLRQWVNSSGPGVFYQHLGRCGIRPLRQSGLGGKYRYLKAGASGKRAINEKKLVSPLGHADAHIGMSWNNHNTCIHPKVFKQGGIQHRHVNAITAAPPQSDPRHAHTFRGSFVAAKGRGTLYVREAHFFNCVINRLCFQIRFLFLLCWSFPVLIPGQATVRREAFCLRQDLFNHRVMWRHP